MRKKALYSPSRTVYFNGVPIPLTPVHVVLVARSKAYPAHWGYYCKDSNGNIGLYDEQDLTTEARPDDTEK